MFCDCVRSLVGSPYYDERADVYSVGIMVAEIILGYMFDTIQLPGDYRASTLVTQQHMVTDASALISPLCPGLAELMRACTLPCQPVPGAGSDRVTAQQAMAMLQSTCHVPQVRCMRFLF